MGLKTEKPKEFDPLICLELRFCESRFGDEEDDRDESSMLSVEPPLSLLLSFRERASGPEDMYSGNTLQRNVFDLEIDPLDKRFSFISVILL